LHKLSKTNRDPTFLAYFKQYKKIFKKCVHASKLAYNNSYVGKSNNHTKAAWNVIKSETGYNNSKGKLISSIQENNKIINDSHGIATVFNQHFKNTCHRLNLSTNIDCAKGFLANVILPAKNMSFFKYTTPVEVYEIIKKLKSSKSAGWDEISSYILKRCSNLLCHPLSVLINKSFREKKFPDLLKYSVINPVLKKGDSSKLENYRPISILPSFCKVFERVAFLQLSAFFEDNAIFCDSQFGFRKGRNTTKAVYELIAELSEAVDGSQYTVGVFCDLSSAFDCVNHELLITKLHHYGVRGNALLWIKSYLNNRKQSVKVNNSVQSPYTSITAGIPQGSILGPFLYLVFANDLPVATRNSKLIAYADDTTSITKHPNQSGLIQNLTSDLMSMNSWFQANGLLLNKDKTFAINFHNNYSNSRF